MELVSSTNIQDGLLLLLTTVHGDAPVDGDGLVPRTYDDTASDDSSSFSTIASTNYGQHSRPLCETDIYTLGFEDPSNYDGAICNHIPSLSEELQIAESLHLYCVATNSDLHFYQANDTYCK